MINFIIDVPVRLDHLLERAGDPWLLQHGSIVYVGCEFQVVDQETAYLNEQGENSHANYKRRQKERVSDRLKWGLMEDGELPPATGNVRASMSNASPLDLTFTDSMPQGSPQPPREPRRPKPELPRMPAAFEEPTQPSGTPPQVGPSSSNYELEEDSLLVSITGWMSPPIPQGTSRSSKEAGEPTVAVDRWAVSLRPSVRSQGRCSTRRLVGRAFGSERLLLASAWSVEPIDSQLERPPGWSKVTCPQTGPRSPIWSASTLPASTNKAVGRSAESTVHGESATPASMFARRRRNWRCSLR